MNSSNLDGGHILNLSAPSGRMLSIAKEIYIRGYFHSIKKSVSDSILSILNFDYAAETILNAVLLDKSIPIERKTGGYRPFDELMQEFKNAFPQINYVTEIISLHKLRNDVQYHCNIPSENEVSRHNTTIRLFFDEICQKVYANSISYSDISLALFIDSENEKSILKAMEEAYQRKDYADSIHYCKRAAVYHVMLLRASMDITDLTNFDNPFWSSDFGDFCKIGNTLEGIVKQVNWLTNKMCIREHYDEINKLLGGLLSNPYFNYYKGEIDERGQSSPDEAEHTRNLIYEFITSTQDLIKQNDLPVPFIFDLLLKKAGVEGNYDVQVGFVSTLEIKSAEIKVVKTLSNEDIQNKVPRKEEVIGVSKNKGINVVCVHNLEKGRQYKFHCTVINEQDKKDEAYSILNLK